MLKKAMPNATLVVFAPRVRMRAMKLLAAVGLVLCTGCAGLGKYAKDRGNDFLDCFQAHAGYGLGADVHVRATRLIVAGAGGSGTRQWGLRGREVAETENMHFGPPLTALLAPFALAMSRQAREDSDGTTAVGCVMFSLSDFCTRTCDGREEAAAGILGIDLSALGLFEGRWTGKTPREPGGLIGALDIEVGGTALVGSIRVGFSPGQLADLVLGLFGLDIAGDDKAPEKGPTPPDKPAAPPAKQE